jgi:cell wall-associated NlpC family hydrolase
VRTTPELTDEQRHEFVAAARRFAGARWAHQGRRPGRMDCLGLVVLSLAEVGILVQDRTDYGRTPYNRRLRTELSSLFGDPVSNLSTGHIVTLRWSSEAHHVAIVTDHPEGLGLIHCWANAPGSPIGGGRVVEHRLDAGWRHRIVEVFRP